MPAAATVFAGISLFSTLFGGSGGPSKLEQITNKQMQQFAASAQEGLSIIGIGLRKERGLKQLSFEERQDEIKNRLTNISIQRQGNIAVARQRSQAQLARVGGVGGSLAQVRTGASELRTEVEKQLFETEIARAAREESRALRTESLIEEAALSTAQAQLTGIATRAGVQTTPIQSNSTHQKIQGVSQFLNTPEVASAINIFFNPSSGSG